MDAGFRLTFLPLNLPTISNLATQLVHHFNLATQFRFISKWPSHLHKPGLSNAINHANNPLHVNGW